MVQKKWVGGKKINVEYVNDVPDFLKVLQGQAGIPSTTSKSSNIDKTDNISDDEESRIIKRVKKTMEQGAPEIVLGAEFEDLTPEELLRLKERLIEQEEREHLVDKPSSKQSTEKEKESSVSSGKCSFVKNTRPDVKATISQRPIPESFKKKQSNVLSFSFDEEN